MCSTDLYFSRLIDSLEASSEVCPKFARHPHHILPDQLCRRCANDSSLALSQTNSTRAKTLELHIAQRVAAELEKIHNHEATALEEIRKKIAAGEESSSGLSSISPKDLLPSLSSDSDEKAQKSQTSQKVQEEIEKLKQTLGQRKVLKELPKDLDTAYVKPPRSLLLRIHEGMGTDAPNRRQSVISCLRINDRKPLDCYKEIEAFKREVRKLEEGYVSSIL